MISPKALLVNKKSEIFNTEKTHYEPYIKQIHNTWTDWTDQYPAIFVTLNGMRFDEEVMRRQFYWNLYDPYFTNTNGNTRLDLISEDSSHCTFLPSNFSTPEINNQLSLKLEDLVSKFIN